MESAWNAPENEHANDARKQGRRPDHRQKKDKPATSADKLLHYTRTPLVGPVIMSMNPAKTLHRFTEKTTRP